MTPEHHPDMHPAMPPVTERKTAHSFSMNSAWECDSRICLFFPGPFPWFPPQWYWLSPPPLGFGGVPVLGSVWLTSVNWFLLCVSRRLKTGTKNTSSHVIRTQSSELHNHRRRDKGPEKLLESKRQCPPSLSGGISFGTLWDVWNRKLRVAYSQASERQGLLVLGAPSSGHWTCDMTLTHSFLSSLNCVPGTSVNRHMLFLRLLLNSFGLKQCFLLPNMRKHTENLPDSIFSLLYKKNKIKK